MPHVQCCGVVSGRVGLCSSVPATGALDPLMALFVPFMEGVGAPVDGWERVAGRPSQPFFFLPSILLFFAVSLFTSRGPPPPLCHNAARLPIPTFLTSMVDSHYCRGTRDLPPLPPFRFYFFATSGPVKSGAYMPRHSAAQKNRETAYSNSASMPGAAAASAPSPHHPLREVRAHTGRRRRRGDVPALLGAQL